MKTPLYLSRRFWLLVVDAVVSLVGLIGGIYLSPDNLKFILGIIAVLQPVVIFVVDGYTKEDVATTNAIAAGIDPSLLKKR